jgi:CRISPR/Cas system CSM-associated protein Csm4 (group 5 of RAMP superfamily)
MGGMPSRDLKMPSRKFTPGSTFKIPFKMNGLLLVGEGDARFDPPGALLGGVRTTPLVVPFQPFSQISRDAGVMRSGSLLTYQNVDVVILGWHAKP